MPPAALKIVLAVVASVNLAFGAFFCWHGAWLVTPFMGLDVLLLGWAFRASLRASLKRERVTLTASRLVVEHQEPDTPPQAVTLNPYWVRVELADPPEIGSRLRLWSHGRAVRVGDFLAPDERSSFARTLKAALRRARDTGSA
jgi:uncharacterized membrane protein